MVYCTQLCHFYNKKNYPIQNVKKCTFAQNLHNFLKLSQKTATPQRTFNHWVQGSSPCASTKENRRNLRIFYYFAMATRIRIFRFFYQKIGFFWVFFSKSAQNLHKINPRFPGFVFIPK